MANALASAAPTWARKVWADASYIYLEIPSTDGPPWVQRYEKCDGGLHRALDLICLAFRQEAPKPGSYKLPGTHPKLRTSTKPGINNFSQEQRDAAAKVLKKLGLVK